VETLLPLVNEKTFRRCFFVVDDRNCAELLRDGDIDAVVRKAIQLGLDPVMAVQMASLNTAEYFHLERLGAIALGYWANVVVLSDLYNFTVEKVFYRGRIVAEKGKALFQPGRHDDSRLIDTMKIKSFRVEAFKLPASGNTYPVIEIVPGQIITKKKRLRVKTSDGFIVPDIERDILKLVVVERHHATGNIGRGLVHGFGLQAGALASSIAHDAHNIIAIGTTDSAIFAAVKEIERLGGGLVIATDDGALTSLDLPIAGILSGEPLPGVVHRLEEIERKARELGTKLDSPFATLSFLTLPVIPELRLTDLGLFDVNAGKLIEQK
jgi:adenine deaminase